MGVGAGTSGSPLTPPLSAPTLPQVEAALRLVIPVAGGG